MCKLKKIGSEFAIGKSISRSDEIFPFQFIENKSFDSTRLKARKSAKIFPFMNIPSQMNV